MRTLEPKDICGYLPSKLAFAWQQCDGSVEIKYFQHMMPPVNFKIVKPVLRPLSDLYKTITHNGKKIVPIVECAKMAFPTKNWKVDGENYAYWFEDLYMGTFSYKNRGFIYHAPKDEDTEICNIYRLYDYLNELKIDYRGLIDDGLALSVYDLENNPYK
jgi:hypothetical protein